MRILSQLVYLSFSVVVPVVLMLLLLWNVVLQAVADFICGAVDQSAFLIALTGVMMAGTWLAGIVTGALLYKQVQDIANQHNY